jgi:hypothetical protein
MTGLATTASAGAGAYLHWGVISVSVTNALIVLAMVILFVLALIVPFPEPHRDIDDERSQP